MALAYKVPQDVGGKEWLRERWLQIEYHGHKDSPEGV